MALLEPVEKYEEQFITIAEYKEALEQANMSIRETQLEQIVERHHSWEDMEEPVYKKERMELRKIQVTYNPHTCCFHRNGPQCACPEFALQCINWRALCYI